MDPGARWSLIIGTAGGLLVLAAALFAPPVAPLLAVSTGLSAGSIYIRKTRRDLSGRAGQGGVIVAPVVVVAQGIGTTVNLLLLGGGLRLGSRLSVLGLSGGHVELPLSMVIALVVLLVLLDLALVLVSAEFTARQALAARREPEQSSIETAAQG